MARSFIVLWLACVLISVASAQTSSPDKTLEELKSRKPQDSASIAGRTEKLSTLDVDALESELKSLQDLHGANRENWNKMQTVRSRDAAAMQAVEARSAKYTLQLWQNQKAHDNKAQALNDKEEKAFKQKFNEAFSKTSTNFAKWSESPESKAIQNERAANEKKFRDTLKSLNDEAAHGNAEREKNLDELQQQILNDFQVTAKAVNKARELLSEKTKKPEQPKPEEKPKVQEPQTPTKTKPSAEEYAQQYTLKFEIDHTLDPPQVVETDEYFEVTVKVSNGKAPFKVTMRTSAGDIKAITLSEPGSSTFPIAFKTPGVWHRVEFTGTDANGVSKSDTLNVIVHKPRIGTKKEPADKVSPNASAPATPSTGATPPAPLLAPMSGTYRAHLWCVGLVPLPPGIAMITDGTLRPVPVSITFDPSGQISGSCNYTAPHTLFNSIHRSMYSSYDWNIQFTINGSVDWQTGIMQLSLPNIRASAFAQNDLTRFDFLDELNASLQGRHTSDPYWEKYLARMGLVAGQPGMQNMDEKEKTGNPNFVLGSQGYRFANDGWYGAMGDHPGITTATGAYKSKSQKLTSGTNVIFKDIINDYQPNITNLIARKQLSWYLKIVGREATPKDMVQMDLVATTISPEKTVTAAPNETVYVEFVGVFSDDFSAPRDLTQVCEWQLPPGVTQVHPGAYRAAKPGTYEIRARAKGKSSNWMEGVVTLEIK